LFTGQAYRSAIRLCHFPEQSVFRVPRAALKLRESSREDPMILVGISCIVLLLFTTVIHYEVLRLLTASLPAFRMPARAKLIVVIFSAFLAHAAEIVLGAGTLGDPSRFSLAQCLYFSAETYSSLGYGDIVPGGDLRLVAGVEVLNGLLLIGWSASYTYIAMERFWNDASEGREKSG
jgi:hypothetical protein